MSQHVLFFIILSLHSVLCKNYVQYKGLESEGTHTPQFLMGINRLQFAHPDIEKSENSRDKAEKDKSVLFENNGELGNKQIFRNSNNRDTDKNIIDDTLKIEANEVDIGKNEIIAEGEIPKIFEPTQLESDKQNEIKSNSNQADPNEGEDYVNLDIRVDDADKALADKVNIHFSYEDTDD